MVVVYSVVVVLACTRVRNTEARDHLNDHHPEADVRVRGVLMRTTRKHIYYVERDDHVLVVAVWGAVTDGGPDLASMSTDPTD